MASVSHPPGWRHAPSKLSPDSGTACNWAFGILFEDSLAQDTDARRVINPDRLRIAIGLILSASLPASIDCIYAPDLASLHLPAASRLEHTFGPYLSLRNGRTGQAATRRPGRGQASRCMVSQAEAAKL